MATKVTKLTAYNIVTAAKDDQVSAAKLNCQTIMGVQPTTIAVTKTQGTAINMIGLDQQGVTKAVAYVIVWVPPPPPIDGQGLQVIGNGTISNATITLI